MVSFAFDLTELVTSNRVCQNDILSLKQWIIKENSIPNLNDKQIAIFLIACDNDIDKVKKCALQYYLTRQNGPEIFDNRDVTRTDILQQLESVQFAIIPKRTSDNCVIIINRLNNSNPSLYHNDIAMKLLFMCYDALLYENPPNGVILIFDMNLTTIRHIPRTKLSTVKIASHYVQECMPIKLKEIHVLNILWFFDKLFTVIKPFLNKELMRKVHLHLPNELKTFSEKHLPLSYLPKDYGGELPTVAELHDETCKKLLSLKKYFEEEEIQRKEIYKT